MYLEFAILLNTHNLVIVCFLLFTNYPIYPYYSSLWPHFRTLSMYAQLLCTREISCTICDDAIAFFSDNWYKQMTIKNILISLFLNKVRKYQRVTRITEIPEYPWNI